MSSSTQICNIALSKIGEDTILSLSENSRSARICNLIYSDMRQAVLRSSHWNFAITRVELALLTTTPVYGFGHQFQLPSDMLKIIGTSYDSYNDVKYHIEGDRLLTSESSISITYIKDFTDEGKFDPLFREALSARIAAEAAVFLTDDEPLHDRMMIEFQTKIAIARSANSQEGTPRGLETTTWTNSRF